MFFCKKIRESSPTFTHFYAGSPKGLFHKLFLPDDGEKKKVKDSLSWMTQIQIFECAKTNNPFALIQILDKLTMAMTYLEIILIFVL